MRISLVTETFPPEVNGVARTLKELATGLMKRGHDLDVVRPHQGPGEDSAAAPPWTTRTVTGVPMGFYPGLRFGLPAPLALARRWNRHRPDVVHIATEGPLGLSALAMAKAMGVPICSSFHTNFHEYGDFYGYGGLRRLAVAFLRAFHNRTQRTLVPSPDVRDALDRRGFERLDLLGRGVDTELFSPTRRSDALRRSWGAGGDDVVAVFVSRLAREKNPALAARTFAELTRRVPGCRAVVVGDGPAMAEMRRRIPEAVFCGMRRGEDLAVHYASADLLLFPSLTETFGNVLTEGLASGLVPVAFDYAAAGLLVSPGENGFTVPRGDADAYVEAAVAAAALPAPRRRELGARAVATARLQTWGHVVARFEEILAQVAHGPASAPAGAVLPVSPMDRAG